MRGRPTTRLAATLPLLLLAACASVPTAPSVMALPGSGRGFEAFRYDDRYCRDYAFEQSGGASAQQRARESAVASAAVGTAVGAAAGAAIGGQHGAAAGAGGGLIVGSAVGMETAHGSGRGTQRLYDNAYLQCMYASGHRIPLPAGTALAPGQPLTQPGIPSPPPGPPPPPPGGRRP